MAEANGFSWTRRKSGEIIIAHHGQLAATLPASKGDAFIAKLENADDGGQALMARLTGNFKRGNERQAGRHPRNR